MLMRKKFYRQATVATLIVSNSYIFFCHGKTQSARNYPHASHIDISYSVCIYTQATDALSRSDATGSLFVAFVTLVPQTFPMLSYLGVPQAPWALGKVDVIFRSTITQAATSLCSTFVPENIRLCLRHTFFFLRIYVFFKIIFTHITQLTEIPILLVADPLLLRYDVPDAGEPVGH